MNGKTRVNYKKLLLTTVAIIVLPLLPLILIDIHKSYITKEWG